MKNLAEIIDGEDIVTKDYIDLNTVTSVNLSNASNGGLTITGGPITSAGSITVGHSNVLASAQTTQAIYPIKIDKNGHISAYGSAVTIPVVPTNVSAFTNDAGYLTSYTDEKLKTTTASNNGTYYFIFGNASTTAETKYYSSNIRYSKATSVDSIQIGQVSSSSTKKGRLTLTSGAYYIYLDPPAYSDISADKTYTLPTSGGTIALTSDIPDVSGKIDTAGTGLSKSGTTLNHTNSVTAQTTQGVYPIKIDAQGHISAYGSAVSIPTKVSDLTNDSGFITSYTDEKLLTSTGAASYVYYLIMGLEGASASTKQIHTGISYVYQNTETATLRLGTSTASGNTGAFYGILELYGTGTYSHKITGDATANRTITLPNKTGTVALTSDIPTISYPVTSVNTKTGAVTLSASDVGAATSDHVHGNITNGGDITATAPTIASGDQIIINDNSASKITNGPTFDGSTTTKALTPKGTWETFAKSDTNTTYTLSNALSSHKFTETLTAGGSGSGTSTATLEFAAGTGITLTDDTTNKKITIASSVVNTDTKVTQNATTDNKSYRVLVSKSDNDTSETNTVGKTSRVYINPSTGDIGLYTSGSEDLDDAIAALNWDSTGSDGVLW